MWNRIFFLLLLFLPFQFATNSIPGNDISLFRLIIPVIFFVWMTDMLRNRGRLFFSHGVLAWFCAAMAVLGVGVLVAPHTDWALRKAFFLGEFLLWFFMVSSLVASGKVERKSIVWGLVWGGAALSLAGIAQWSGQFIWGLEPMLHFWEKGIAPFFLGEALAETVSEYSSWLVNVGGVTVFRAIGPFPDPHSFAFFLELCLPWAIFLFIKTRRKFLLFVAVILLIGIGLSFSRGAYVGMVVSGIVFAGFAPKLFVFSRRKTLILLTVFAGMLGMLLGTPNFVRDRLEDTFFRTDASGDERIVLWETALQTIAQHPLFGVGFAGFPEQVQPSAQYRDPIYAHNTYLDIATETGLLGLFLFLFGCLWAARQFLALGKRDVLYYGGFFALICVGVHGMFDTALYSVQDMGVFCVLMAIATDASKEEKNV